MNHRQYHQVAFIHNAIAYYNLYQNTKMMLVGGVAATQDSNATFGLGTPVLKAIPEYLYTFYTTTTSHMNIPDVKMSIHKHFSGLGGFRTLAPIFEGDQPHQELWPESHQQTMDLDERRVRCYGEKEDFKRSWYE